MITLTTYRDFTDGREREVPNKRPTPDEIAQDLNDM